MQAFVQFLEQESQPKSDDASMPNLLNITQQNSPSAGSASQPARRISTSSNSGAGAATATIPAAIPIQPLLLNDFAPSRNSSSILKDILNDS